MNYTVHGAQEMGIDVTVDAASVLKRAWIPIGRQGALAATLLVGRAIRIDAKRWPIDPTSSPDM